MGSPPAPCAPSATASTSSPRATSATRPGIRPESTWGRSAASRSAIHRPYAPRDPHYARPHAARDLRARRADRTGDGPARRDGPGGARHHRPARRRQVHSHRGPALAAARRPGTRRGRAPADGRLPPRRRPARPPRTPRPQGRTRHLRRRRLRRGAGSACTRCRTGRSTPRASSATSSSRSPRPSRSRRPRGSSSPRATTSCSPLVGGSAYAPCWSRSGSSRSTTPYAAIDWSVGMSRSARHRPSPRLGRAQRRGQRAAGRGDARRGRRRHPPACICRAPHLTVAALLLPTSSCAAWARRSDPPEPASLG